MHTIPNGLIENRFDWGNLSVDFSSFRLFWSFTFGSITMQNTGSMWMCFEEKQRKKMASKMFDLILGNKQKNEKDFDGSMVHVSYSPIRNIISHPVIMFWVHFRSKLRFQSTSLAVLFVSVWRAMHRPPLRRCIAFICIFPIATIFI